eukprot:TRINITY_DN6445_c3_g1_i1.p1 TRINITY_DN6445_c3_g1~~TRINITY_DN6445_c3_g1_i1.p1  ORF type:complete len:219 (-),score=28.64 TRINITY_DN6445_c3_g1_i1:97-753(-)
MQMFAYQAPGTTHSTAPSFFQRGTQTSQPKNARLTDGCSQSKRTASLAQPTLGGLSATAVQVSACLAGLGFAGRCRRRGRHRNGRCSSQRQSQQQQQQVSELSQGEPEVRMRKLSEEERAMLAQQMDSLAPYRNIVAFLGLLIFGKAAPDAIFSLLRHFAGMRGSENLDYPMLASDAVFSLVGIAMLYSAFKYLGPPEIPEEIEEDEAEAAGFGSPYR